MRKRTEDYILRHYTAISFDVFDTLLERDVPNPSDIFVIVGEKALGPGHGRPFCANRQYAEHKARNGAENREATLREIYQNLGGYTQEQKEVLMQEEINAEMQHCRPKQSVQRLYRRAIKAGKQVYLISDMYLPARVIEGMLEKCGVDGYNKLYVSNQYRVGKRGGGLYQVVMRENGIDSRRMVHLGDSIRADYLGARRAGVRGRLVRSGHIETGGMGLWMG